MSIGIGFTEIVLVCLLASSTLLTRGVARRWLAAYCVAAAFSAATTPADLLSTLIWGCVVIAAFTAGVWLAPRFHRDNAAQPQGRGSA